MFPAPWQLSGRGLIVVYRLPKSWLLEHGGIPAHLQNAFVGGFSALMLVDYSSSNCGGYQELLFVPGMFQVSSGQRFLSISQIMVSSASSVQWGIRNWGIPKSFANFIWSRDGVTERVEVLQNNISVAEFVFSSGNTALLISLGVVPATWRTLMHPELEGINLVPKALGDILLTTLAGTGKMRLAKLHLARGDGLHFPNLELIKPVAAVLAEPFNLVFPIPQRVKL